MKSQALRQKTKEELMKTLHDTEEALGQFRFSIAGAKTKNVREGRTLRRQIAQIKTVLSSQ